MKSALTQNIQRACNPYYKAAEIIVGYQNEKKYGDLATQWGITSLAVWLQHLVVADTDEEFDRVFKFLSDLNDTGVFHMHICQWLIKSVIDIVECYRFGALNQ